MSTCNGEEILGCAAEALEAALQTREDMGLAFQKVCLVTRTWSGRTIGDGKFKDKDKSIKPTPIVKKHDFSVMLNPGGSVKQGDRIIQKILKKYFPLESDVDTRVKDCPANVEMMYKIGDALFNVIHVTEEALYWDVQVRRVIDARR